MNFYFPVWQGKMTPVFLLTWATNLYRFALPYHTCNTWYESPDSFRLLEAQQDPRHILLLCQTNVAVDGVLKTLFLGEKLQPKHGS